jgi:hypothetical protein
VASSSGSRVPERPSTNDRSLAHVASHWLLVALGTIPFVVGAVSLWVDAGGGLYWIAAGAILATAGAVATAWVLLVEILR